ncbi:hypothetical protein [Ruminococcus sp.]|uniref:hypothetical protein n=1 Tax=Ruminococcus sp. TaxID=41978 RepID=UPI0025D380D7|nr:hypothetical protein [Ruminococcus sp.]MCR4638794.1 DivIVA domain-containing protein [Ruminococcus sp.]
MTDKEFKHLKRSDLIYIIYEYQKKQEELIKENEELREKLKEKELKISNSGSLAEISAKLNGLFEAAQQTADDYIRGVENSAVETAEKKAQKLIRDAQEKAQMIISEAEYNVKSKE